MNSGNPETDEAVCGIVEDQSAFCPIPSGRDKLKTQCGQQYSGSEGVSCIRGESWAECPAVIGSTNVECKQGATGGPAGLSNFASYKICLGAGGATCQATGVCETDAVGGSSYNCMVSSGCTSGEPVTCLSTKCDIGTCPCAINL